MSGPSELSMGDSNDSHGWGRRVGLVGGAAAVLGAPMSALLLASVGHAGASGATFVVDSLGDGSANPSACTTPVAGSCTLRSALAAAVDGDVITFAPDTRGTLTLNSALSMTAAVTIAGPGAGELTVYQTSHHRIFEISPAASDVVISGLTLAHGDDSDRGGAIRAYNTGSLTIDSVVLTGNRSASGGAALFVAPGGTGAVVIRDTTIDGNASGSAKGGALYLGGSGRTVTIVDSTISNNSSEGSGGAIGIVGSGNDVTIANCTLAGNSADSGGAAMVYDTNTVRFVMSTISGNASTHAMAPSGYAGGVSIEANTFSPNAPRRAVSFVGTIISGNSSTASSTDVDLSISGSPSSVTLANSLVGFAAPFTDGGGNLRSSEPGIGALADNGGPTLTMALLPGSPAIGGGPSVVPSFLGNTWDQRGEPYLRRIGTRVDIGAFQLQSVPGPEVPTFTG